MGKVWSYKIFGETPAKKNGQTFNARFKRMIKNESFYTWHRNALKLLLCFDRPHFPLEAAKIEIIFFHNDLRRRDGDNALASVQDLLIDAGIIRDDSWPRIGTPAVFHDLDIAPYCIITVEETEPGQWEKKLKEMKKAQKLDRKKSSPRPCEKMQIK